jgi:AcrR family transcriptional regulator
LDRFEATRAARRRAKQSAKRRRVLSAASELFASSDYHEVRMEEIARRSGVGKGTLYNLFDSKENLYFSIIRTRLEQLLEILDRAYDRREDTLRNLRSLILHLHKFMSKHPHFYLIWKREESSLARGGRGDIGDLYGRLNLLLRKVLQRGAAEGVVRPGMDGELVAHLLLGMIDGLRKSPQNVHRREQAIDDLLVVLLKGIGVEGLEARVEYDSYRHVKGGR